MLTRLGATVKVGQPEGPLQDLPNAPQVGIRSAEDGMGGQYLIASRTGRCPQSQMVSLHQIRMRLARIRNLASGMVEMESMIKRESSTVEGGP